MSRSESGGGQAGRDATLFLTAGSLHLTQVSRHHRGQAVAGRDKDRGAPPVVSCGSLLAVLAAGRESYSARGEQNRIFLETFIWTRPGLVAELLKTYISTD